MSRTIGIVFFAVVFAQPLPGRTAGAQPDRKPAAAAKPAPFDPTAQYEARHIEGWRVLLNRRFLHDSPALCDEALKLLGFQLYQIPRKVPAEAVAKLRKVTIWVEEAEPHHPCMAYHPSPDWLREHGMNPDKGGCVEVANARTFLAWTREQPWMVLHELAHAYHDRFLGGFNNAELAAAFQRIQAAHRYDSVLYYRGQNKRAYAATNVMEYFAETSEAFFGTNDFYPFVRSELKQHDPEMEKLLQRLWGCPPEK